MDVNRSIKITSVDELAGGSLNEVVIAYSQAGTTAYKAGFRQGIGDSLITTRKLFPPTLTKRQDPSRIGIGRLIDYFHANPSRKISTEIMIQITGQRRRSLFYNFKKYTGYTPQQYFKRVRLSACHKHFSDDDKSVTATALDYNFFHLGEFSAIYKSVYGELPSETQKNSSRQHSSQINRITQLSSLPKMAQT